MAYYSFKTASSITLASNFATQQLEKVASREKYFCEKVMAATKLKLNGKRLMIKFDASKKNFSTNSDFSKNHFWMKNWKNKFDQIF